MKAKELMCDDIVSHNGNLYRVFGIMEHADGVQITPIHLRNSEGLLLGPISCFASDIEPIPLTPEILEKNGWWYDIEDMWQHDEVNFGIEKWNGRFQCYDINQIKLYSVHELQHTLRMCGLTDLADNFKV